MNLVGTKIILITKTKFLELLSLGLKTKEKILCLNERDIL